MKRWNIALPALPAAFVVALLASGCYTQLGTVRNDRDKEYKEDEEYAKTEEYADDQEYAEEDTVTQGDYDNARQRFYSDGYDAYPYIGFGFGYYDPWYWRHAGYYYYSPSWYDPIWGWCGTSYPRYYASGYWGGSSYNSWYRRGHYTYRTGGNVVTRPGGAYGATRTFGSTRTPMGATRGGTDVLPSGARAGSGLGKQGSDATSISRTGARRADTRPAATTGSSTKSGTRYGGTREGSRSSTPSGTTNRGGVRRSEPSGGYSPSPSAPSGNSGGGYSGRSSGSSAPASSPAPSSSGGGHAPSNSGSRGGERR
jgi:hypothetical protein